MRHKYLLCVSLVKIAVIAIRPMLWLGSIGFAGLMLLLAVAVGLLVTYLLSLKRGSWRQALSLGFLAVAAISSIVVLWLSAPELTGNEVKSIMNATFSKNLALSNNYNYAHATSAEYKGQGIWQVKVITSVGIAYVEFNEKTGATKVMK